MFRKRKRTDTEKHIRKTSARELSPKRETSPTREKTPKRELSISRERKEEKRLEKPSENCEIIETKSSKPKSIEDIKFEDMNINNFYCKIIPSNTIFYRSRLLNDVKVPIGNNFWFSNKETVMAYYESPLHAKENRLCKAYINLKPLILIDMSNAKNREIIMKQNKDIEVDIVERFTPKKPDQYRSSYTEADNRVVNILRKHPQTCVFDGIYWSSSDQFEFCIYHHKMFQKIVELDIRFENCNLKKHVDIDMDKLDILRKEQLKKFIDAEKKRYELLKDTEKCICERKILEKKTEQKVEKKPKEQSKVVEQVKKSEKRRGVISFDLQEDDF